MKTRIPKKITVESLYPNPRGRQLADEAVDILDVALPMSAFLDTYDEAYFQHTGKSPFRTSS